MADHPDALTHPMTTQVPTGNRVTVLARSDTPDPLVLRFPVGWGL